VNDEKALRVPDYLSHIVEAAKRIGIYTAGMAREQFSRRRWCRTP